MSQWKLNYLKLCGENLLYRVGKYLHKIIEQIAVDDINMLSDPILNLLYNILSKAFINIRIKKNMKNL